MPWELASCKPLSVEMTLFVSQSHLFPINSRSTSDDACCVRGVKCESVSWEGVRSRVGVSVGTV